LLGHQQHKDCVERRRGEGLMSLQSVANDQITDKPVQVELDMDEWYNLCRERPDAFAHYYFKHILRSPSSDFHFLLYSLIKKINETPYPNNIAIAAPRGSAKTQIINVILPIWCAAFELKKFIVVMSETSRLAEANLESIKYELTSNELLAEHFPHLVGEGATWRKEVIDTCNDIRIIAVGSGKQVRGSQKKGGHRPDLTLCHPAGTKILGTKNNIDVSMLTVGDKVYNHNWEEDEIIAWKPHTWTGDYYKFKLYGHPEEIVATAGHQFFVRKRVGKKYIRTGNHMKCLDRGKWKRNQYECLVTYSEPKKLNVREIEKGDMVGYKINTKIIPIEEIARKENWNIYKPGGEIINRDDKGRIVQGGKGSYKPVNIGGKEWWLASKEFWWLAGVFLGDGTVDRKTGYSTRFSCNPSEIDHINKIIRSIEFLGNTPSKIREKTVVSIHLSNRLINYIFNQWKREKNSHKVPSRNIEFLDPELQRQLILGYIAADGWVSKEQGVRITSVCFELLEFIQRILLRQGIVSSIRNGIKGGEVKIFDRIVNTQDKYDLYFKQDAWKLGLLPKPKSKLKLNKRWFIEDDTVWRKVKSIGSEYKTDIVFPFKVRDEHSYLTTQFYSLNCDDLSSDEMVRTKKRRDDHEDWFRRAVMGMEGTADTKMDVIVTGTILHPHCLLSKLLDPKIFAGWESYKYKAIYEFSKSPLWKTWEHLYTSYEDEKREETAYNFFKAHEKEMLEGTKVLWPEGDGYYKLMVYKIKAGPRAFASEKQNTAIDPSQTLFDPQRIVYFDRRDIDLDKLVIYGAIDPASGEAKRQGDLSAVVTIGRDPKSGIIYVLDVMAAAKGPSYCIKYIKRVHELYDYRKFGVDQDALKMLKDFIEKDIPDLQGKLTLYDLRLPKPKRIDRLEPIIHSGLLRFQRNQLEATEELTFYPNSEHDDVLDALEIAVRLTGHRGYRLLTY